MKKIIALFVGFISLVCAQPVYAQSATGMPSNPLFSMPNYRFGGYNVASQTASTGTPSALSSGTKLKVSKAVLNTALSVYFPDASTRTKAAAAYKDFVKQNNNAGITANQLREVCKVGGIFMQQTKCENFIKALSKPFKKVCDSDDGGSYESKNCIKVFSNVQVIPRTGDNLAADYARLNLGDTIICKGTHDYWVSRNDDFKECRSISNPDVRYQFQFDDLKESVDADVNIGTRRGICSIFGYYQPEHFSGCYHKTNGALTEQDCAKIATLAKGYGYRVEHSNNHCNLIDNKFTDASQLINSYEGIIDNFVYSSGKDQTQLQAKSSLDESIKAYCQTRLAPTKVTSFECAKAHKVWVRGLLENNEDIVTCYVNGKRVDFVFDDLTQSNVLWGQNYIDGSEQGLGCRAIGGVFDGEHCADLNKEQCVQVAKLNLKDCPGCKQAYWDASKQICMLPASSTAKTTKTVVNVATKSGVAVVTLAVVVTTGGTALALVGAATATAGAIVSDVGRIVQDNDASDWMVEMNSIKTPEQAAAFLKAHLQEIIGTKSLEPKRINALSEMLVKVIKTAPTEFYKEIAAGCTMENGVYNNTLSTCLLNPDNGKSTVQAIIDIGDAAHLIGSVLMIADALHSVYKVFTSRVQDASKIVAVRDGATHGNVMFRDAGVGGGVGRFTSNTVFQNAGVASTNTGAAAALGAKVGDVFYVTSSGAIMSQVATQGVNLASLAGGVANATVAIGDRNLANVQLSDKQAPQPEPTPEDKVVPQPNPTPEDKVVPQPNPKPNPQPGPKPAPQENKNTPNFEKQPDMLSGGGMSNSVSGVKQSDMDITTYHPVQQQVASDIPVTSERTIDPHAVDKKPNVGLIATAAVAGTLLTGGLIGGLVGAKNKKDDQKNTAAPAPAVPTDIEKILNVASGPFGYVDNRQISLIPLPTTVGTYAPIVTVANQAVVVVDYQNYQLPYYLDGVYKSWMPLLGIGETGGWFNVFKNPTDTGIRAIDQIRLALNKNITPSVVTKYIGAVNNGLQFPDASPAAFQTINAMFVNGVVQTNNGTLSPADQALYNSNYTILQNALK